MKIQFCSPRASSLVRLLACTVLGFWVGQPRALADYETWKFSGVITSSTASPSTFFGVGLPCSWSFTLDTSQLATTASGIYYPTVGFTFSAGDYGYSGSAIGDEVLIANDQPVSGGGSFDGIMFSDSTGAQFGGSPDGVTLENFSSGPTATPFTSTGFPSTLDLNEFSDRDMALNFQGGSYVIGSVDALYINGNLVSEVPEPETGVLFGLGLLLCAMITSSRSCVRREEQQADWSPADGTQLSG